MAIKLGSIVIDLQANTVSFSNAMDKASQVALNSSRNIQRSLSYIGTAATAMAAGVIASLTAVIDTAEDTAFTMQRMAETVGTSSEMFSKLAYSAKLSGTPLETLQTSMERLSKTAGAARSGSKEQLQAFAALGIGAKDLDGPLKDAGALTIAVAKKMDAFSDSTNKTALEQKLFGRSGAELAPLMKQLASGFDTASQQATLFGVVVGDKTASQAKKLHESMVQLESVALGFSLRLLSGVAPALDGVAQKMVTFATSSEGMKTVDTIASHLSGTVNGLGTAFDFLTTHSTAVKRTLEGVAALQVASVFVPMISSAAKASKGLDSIGLVGIKMISRMSGISALLPILSGVTREVQLQTFMLSGLAKSEGIASAASYGLARAQKALGTAATAASSSVGVAAGVITAGLGITALALENERHKAEQSYGASVTWGDMWSAALVKVTERAKELKLVWDVLHGAMDQQDMNTWAAIKKNGILGENGGDVAGRIAKQRSDLHRYLTAPDLVQGAVLPAAKKEAPALPKEAVAKVDELQKKLMELRDSAQAAQKALADAGKGVDFQRRDEIDAESKKVIDELTLSLGAKGRALSEADKAAIRSSIATRVNDESQARFRDEVVRSTEQILAQAGAQGILTAAIGKGAEAVRQAQVDSEFKTKYAGQSEEWMKANTALIEQQKAARLSELSAGDTHTNKAALDNVKQQIDAQKVLNAAILAGRIATEQARFESEQAAIRKQYADRGDTNQTSLDAELARNAELFNAKQRESDLTRAASMDAARLYNDEAAAIRNAAQAANDAGEPLSALQVSAAQKQAWDDYLATVDKAALAVGSASDGFSVFFDQMTRQTVSAAQQVHDVLGGAFESLNSTLERMVTGQKASFAEMFRGIAGQLAKVGIQKIEGGIVAAITGKKQGDPTVSAINTTNSILMQIRDQRGGLGAGGVVNSITQAASGAGSKLSQGLGYVSPLLNMIPGGGFLSGLFGGHFALGGDVNAGVPIDVGEMGRETFIPTQNGKIVPNSQTRGQTINMPIDARGSTDPAQTEAAIHRAMAHYAPAIASGAVKTVHEQGLRRPPSTR